MMTSWESVVDYLLENMQKQTYKKDGRLPSEYELAQRFELIRIKVREAYDRLKEMGYVYSQQGRGNHYAGCLEEVELVLSSTDSFSMRMSPLASCFFTRPLSRERIAWYKDTHERLAVVQGEPVPCAKRLRYLGHMPAVMYISYAREKSLPNIRECPRKNPSLYVYLQDRGIQDVVAEDIQLTISTLNMEERLYMKVSDIAPCFMLKGVSRNCKAREILELSTIIYWGDKFVFRL